MSRPCPVGEKVAGHKLASLYLIGASLSEPHIVVISITFSCTSVLAS